MPGPRQSRKKWTLARRDLPRATVHHHLRFQTTQQQSHAKPSGTASAVMNQAGGKSSRTTSRTGLKNLKWWRVSPIQNTTTVSSGGQPGRPQAISDTRIVTSAASVKRSRVHARTRASASWYAGLFFSGRILVDAGVM